MRCYSHTACTMPNKLTTLTPGKEITDQDVLSQIHIVQSKMYGFKRTIRHNPCPNPVSIQQSDLPTLQANQYMVGLKDDGVRYHLLLSKKSDKACFAAFVNRSNQAYYVPVAAQQSLYNGTLFDGELVEQDNQLVYRIFDVVGVDGHSIAHVSSLLNRLAEAERCLKDSRIACLQKRMSFQMKPLVSKHQIQSLQSHWISDDTSDGLVFLPLDGRIVTGTHSRMFKLKTYHTIDLDVVQVNDFHKGKTNEYYLRDADKLVPVKSATVRLNGLPVQLHVHNNLLSYDTVSVVECQVDELQDLGYAFVADITPLMLRPDKPCGNNLLTIERTLHNIRENITFSEVSAVCSNP